MDNKDCILIWTDSYENLPLIEHCHKLANMLNVSCTMMCSSPFSQNFNFKHSNGNTIEYKREKASQFIRDIKNELGILFIVTDVDFVNNNLTKNSIKRVRDIKRTELPFICLKSDYSLDIYKNIVTITGYEKGEKNKVMWSNYLTKKLNGTSNLIVPTEKDEYIAIDIADIIAYSTKLFSKTNNKYKLHPSILNTEQLKKTTMHCLANSSSLFIANQKFVHLNPLTLPRDIKLINESEDNTIMIVPEADDSLIPCH